MKLLDLFSCCGGISKGYHNCGFECTGVDINDDHRYPYNFIHSDVFKLPLSFFEKFDLIHASPPCQHYCWGLSQEQRNKHLDLVEKTRNLLLKTKKPFVIENIMRAPIRKDLVLCGEMFGLRVIRHRKFEIEGFSVLNPPHNKHKNSILHGTAVGVYNGGDPGFWGDNEKRSEFRARRKSSYYAQVAGHGGDSYSFKIEDWKKAMGIDWVNDKKHLTQMIPPKYSEYIGKFFN